MNFLAGRNELKTAAVIAKTFRIDPVEVLNSTALEWGVRKAAFDHVQRLERAEAEKMKSRGKKR